MMKTNNILILTTLAICLMACRSDDLEEVTSVISDEVVDIETPDWTEATHSDQVDPDYTTVFPENEILRIDITINSEYWNAMQADLAANIGSSGPGNADLDFTPIWVPCSFQFNGIEWYQTGIRYKGNSSLINAYNSSGDKYPFKLDFDEFEDNYPAIENQRFYGFKQLNLGNNFDDDSFMREKVAADLFREFGIPAARTAFCAVYLDRGNGSEYIGLYTLVEEVDDTVIDSQFEFTDGNLYKPDGTAASFAQGTYNTVEMDKKSNEDENDFSDVEALYNVLHSTTRTSDEDQWKSDLESVFDVDHFLKYLAVNNTIQNWDTYGLMTHNYFLYNNEGKITWIPWDNNEAFQNGKRGGAISLSTSEVGTDWPIINYLMSVEEYQAIYKGYLGDFVAQVFEPSRMLELYSVHESLLQSYATQETGSFNSAVSQLQAHATSRNEVVASFIN